MAQRLPPVPATLSIASAVAFTIRSICSSVDTSGGAKRMLSPFTRVMMPRSRSARTSFGPAPASGSRVA